MDKAASLAEPFNRAMDAGTSAWGRNWMPERYACAPGRVEVLGNHIDYNGGQVLAAAIDRYTVVLGQQIEPPDVSVEVVFADVDRPGPALFKLSEAIDWRNETESQLPEDFVRGAIASLIARGKAIEAGQFAIGSSVPMGMGVSSSAALCVALAMALCGEPLEYEELVLIAQEAEHRAGTPCGTMDQSASVSGGMIRFDGSDHSATQLNPDLDGHAFLVIDSGVKRSLSNSSYPRRVEECRKALARINAVSTQQFPNLASISAEGFAHLGSALEPPLRQRVRHVVSEVERVHEGENALANKDWKRFGALMTESGRSSALNYEISHEVVESIVDRLIQTPGVLGARMMGGGEGGSVIALIAPDDQAEILRQAEALANASGTPGAGPNSVYRFNFASGARSGSVTDLLPR